MKKVGMMPLLKQFLAVALLGCLAIQIGCGGEEPMKKAAAEASDDQKAIAAMVNGLSDMAQRKDEFRKLFTRDAAPKTADIKKFKDDYAVSVEGDYATAITVSGSSATIAVNIRKIGTEGGSPASWKATKDGDSWKLSSAPLP